MSFFENLTTWTWTILPWITRTEIGIFWPPLRPISSIAHMVFERPPISNYYCKKNPLQNGLKNINSNILLAVKKDLIGKIWTLAGFRSLMLGCISPLSSKRFFIQTNSRTLWPYCDIVGRSLPALLGYGLGIKCNNEVHMY